MSELQLISWNVRGLNKLVKLKQVVNRIKQLKAKIVFLQETHLTPEDVVKVRRRWPGRVFFGLIQFSLTWGDYSNT